MSAKRVVECRRCLRRLSSDPTGWVVFRPPGGSPEFECPNCTEYAAEHGPTA